MSRHQFVHSGLAVIAVTALASAASGAVILPGFYSLHNHPDGNVNPPPYGAKFTELYDVTGSADIFTLDFDDPASDAELFYNGTDRIVISGHSWGGRSTGSTYENDVHLGIYEFYFEYSIGVAPVPGDDDIHVSAPNHSNFGWIRTPIGDVISLTDEVMGGYSFRFGDEDNDLGHRGFPGLSGWGWMTHHWQTMGHIADTDWLFTATFDRLIPAPACLNVLGLLTLAGLRRRR